MTSASQPSRRCSWSWLLGLALLLLAGLTACKSPSVQSAAFPDPTVVGTETETLPLSQGDVIRVTFESVTNLNSIQAIMLDGTVSLPMVGQTKAAGLTIAEFEAAVKALYQSELKVTDLIVSRVASAASYSVGGAVLKPGKLPLDRPMTVLEAIMEAGGVNFARAKLGEVVVLRIENGRRTRHVIDIKRSLRGKEPNLFYIKPFDVIFVPEKTFNF